MQYDRTVIGYHGCDERFAIAILHGKKALRPSINAYDWLGHGIYFWEFGAQRAFEFATWKLDRGEIRKPAVIGALIQLGTCFDLLDTRFTDNLRQAFPAFRSAMRKKRWPLPKNAGPTSDNILRHRDCAVLNWYLREAEDLGTRYQTVRCAFTEGARVFPSAGMRMKNHIQIAVRDPACILGVFRPNVLVGS